MDLFKIEELICLMERQMSLEHHYLDEWKMHLIYKYKAWPASSGRVLIARWESAWCRPRLLCLCDMNPNMGVSLRVFGRYLTKHLSGNMRCWYSRSPPSYHMRSVFWEWAACLKPSGTGVWSGGEHGLVLLTARKHSSWRGASPLTLRGRPPTDPLTNGAGPLPLPITF